MTDRPNMRGINYTWTQPYPQNWSYNPFYQSVEQQELELELDRLDAVDVLVDQMLTYPDAEAIINRIKQQGANDA